MSVQTKMDNLAVKFLSPEDINVAASVLYQAYHDDPLLKHVLQAKHEASFEKKLRALIREELSAFGHTGQPLVGLYNQARLMAVACVIADSNELEASRQWHWRLRLMMSAGYLQTQQLIEKERVIREELQAHEPYHFLSFIAVDPHVQGLGYGHYLLIALDDLLSQHDKTTGMAVFITQQDHLAFFTAHDYHIVKNFVFSSVEGTLLFKKK
ncbi:N-acetyltransferase [Pseudoalteromonas sp. McH1-7]|uniref:N-acetyltransferase n=1 Tax=Pseudoalteromonas TaxID=53246 RepID=UPI00159029FC|nr:MULTISPECIES: N-acetyltransferase [Pseudoalteromonas]MDW7547803.1 N-acetyltransferase [Pseudoalteromonas peptidolytica]NUZ11349.1 N-acetyltransferase [Pseudoalteromonas sp. McH1-7]USD27594.1 N-acetyltransferase [Pseudoalteromonas sp. SCSIO 43201]